MNYRTADQAFLERQKDGSYPAVIYRATIGRDTIYTPQYSAACEFADIAGLERQIVEIRHE